MPTRDASAPTARATAGQNRIGASPIADTHARQRQHRSAHPPAAFVRVRRRLRARCAEENHRARLRETRQRQGPGHRQHDRGRHGGPRRRPLARHCVEESEIHQPFADKPVERRQTRDGDRAEREQPRRPRHRAPQSAEPAHLPRARGVQHRTGAEEQQRLERAVIPHVQQRPGQRQSAPRRVAVRDREQRAADADQDDADVLHRTIRQQALEIVLREANAMPSNALVAPSPITTQPAAGGTGSQPLKRTMP